VKNFDRLPMGGGGQNMKKTNVGKNTKYSLFFKIRGGANAPPLPPRNDVPDVQQDTVLNKKNAQFQSVPYT